MNITELLNTEPGPFEPTVDIAVGLTAQRFNIDQNDPLYDAVGEIARLGVEAMQSAVKAAEAQAQAAEAETLQDGLTGLDNRRGFEQNMAIITGFTDQYEIPLSLIILYFDNLKDINDQQSHSAGDAAIRTAADILRQHSSTTFEATIDGKAESVNMRPPARLEGGDEFPIPLVGMGTEDATRWWECVRTDFAQHGIIMSAGLATFYPQNRAGNDSRRYVLDQASLALLAARGQDDQLVCVSNLFD
jgi:diguanylate cyclase (GGDEF)-like protein